MEDRKGKTLKTGIIDVGGGLRGAYGLGVFDFCLDHNIRFDLCIGVSAGSANISSFLAGQRKRNFPFYTVYPFRKEYMGLKSLLKNGSILNLDYIYSELSNSDGENPLDYPAIVKNPAEMIVVATNAKTAEAVYFTKADLAQDHYDILKASSAIPFICKPYSAAGIACYDGALSDPVPVEKAFQEGCDKVVVILTKPKDVLRTPGDDPKLAAMIRLSHPKVSAKFKKRYQLYNAQVAKAKQYEAAGKALVLAPDNIEGMSTLKKDVTAITTLYKKGYHDAEALKGFLL